MLRYLSRIFQQQLSSSSTTSFSPLSLLEEQTLSNWLRKLKVDEWNYLVDLINASSWKEQSLLLKRKREEKKPQVIFNFNQEDRSIVKDSHWQEEKLEWRAMKHSHEYEVKSFSLALIVRKCCSRHTFLWVEATKAANTCFLSSYTAGITHSFLQWNLGDLQSWDDTLHSYLRLESLNDAERKKW